MLSQKSTYDDANPRTSGPRSHETRSAHTTPDPRATAAASGRFTAELRSETLACPSEGFGSGDSGDADGNAARAHPRADTAEPTRGHDAPPKSDALRAQSGTRRLN